MIVRIRQEDFKYFHELYLEGSEYFRRFPFKKENEVFTFESLTKTELYTILHNDKVAGFFSLSNFDTSGLSAEIGFILKKEYRDKVEDGVKLAFKFEFEFIKQIFLLTHIRRLTGTFLAHRKDFLQAYLRGGFKKEGHFKESCYWQGKYHDEIRVYITKPMFEKKYGRL